jgi:quercetin dioxygenase-like cupin family protein
MPDRPFEMSEHIRNVFTEPEVKLLNEDGEVLSGITGVAGVADIIDSGMEIGADRLVMQPGAAFELHTHPGAHILYVLRNRGFIHVDGVDYEMVEGDTVYVPANFAHGVRTALDTDDVLEILAFGVPHMPVDSTERMTLVR